MQGNSDAENNSQKGVRQLALNAFEIVWTTRREETVQKNDVVRDLFSADMLKLLSAEPKCHLGPCSTMLMFSLDVKIAWWLCRASTGDGTVNIQPMGNRH